MPRRRSISIPCEKSRWGCLTWSPATGRRPSSSWKAACGYSRPRSAEPDSLAVSIDFDQRAEFLAEAPDVYYLTDHYVNYPVVLVRLSRIHLDALKDLLGMALAARDS
jgi:hypothetical protein